MRKNRFIFGLLSVMMTLLLASNFAAAQGPVEIEFWHAFTGVNQEETTKLINQFNESQSAIHVTEQSKNGYDPTLNAVIQAAGQGEGPNMAQIFDLGTPLAIDSGFFVPVESVMTPEQIEAIKADVAAPLINYFTIGGQLWSLPWNNSTPILYYNKDMFEAAGLDPETPPATWQELEAACEAIMTSGAAPYCLSAQIYGWYFEQWMALQSGKTSTTKVTGRIPVSFTTIRVPTRFSLPNRQRLSSKAPARCVLSRRGQPNLDSNWEPVSSRRMPMLTVRA
jgi:sn-glycerol 3-phosphate transport system substrate-binding protein